MVGRRPIAPGTARQLGDAGGGYTVNVELDWYRGSRDREMGVVDTDHHFSLSVGLELGLGKATFGL
jgi:hypothetical protein